MFETQTPQTQNLIKRLSFVLQGSDEQLLSLVIERLELCDELQKQVNEYKELEKARRTW